MLLRETEEVLVLGKLISGETAVVLEILEEESMCDEDVVF